MQESIEKIKAKYSDFNIEKIKSAFEFTKILNSKERKHHKSRNYYDHVCSILDTLLEFNIDEDTIIVAILHEILAEKNISYEEIENKFGSSVASLVESIENLRSLHLSTSKDQSENYKKLLFAMAKDLRVVLIRLADRLDIMMNINELEDEAKKNISKETMNIYVPLAMHLGIYKIKTKLEDLAFEYMLPEEYKILEDELKKYKYNNQDYIDSISNKLQEIIKRNNIPAKLTSRIKHRYSIYQKFISKANASIDSVFDIFAFRIILDEKMDENKLIAKCYEVLGIVHNELNPITNRFKDYIAHPKSNGYRSLHTTVLGLGDQNFNKPVEIQIRTEEMHTEAEYGIAAHSIYKENSNLEDTNNSKFIKSLLDLQKKIKETNFILNDFEFDISNDTIFVLSEDGMIYDMPENSTALDFAYNISEDIGHKCSYIKVNGVKVPFDYVLQNADMVSIQTDIDKSPSYYSISFVKTSKAKDSLKKWFTAFDQSNLINWGKSILNKALEAENIILDDKLSILENFGNQTLVLRERQELLILLAKGEISVNQIIDKILPSIDEKSNIKVENKNTKILNNEKNKILVTGENNLPIEFCSCCNISDGDPIMGYVGRGNSIKIHNKYCKQIINSDHNRLIEASWANKPKIACEFYIEFKDRIGIISDITKNLSSRMVNITKFNYEGGQKLEIYCKLDSIYEAENIKEIICSIPDIVECKYKIL